MMNVKWNKVSPADLSSMECTNYFAFSINNKVFFSSEVKNECLFTSVILACANYNHSIYDIQIWVGCITEKESKKVISINPFLREDILESLEWFMSVQKPNYNLANFSRA